MKSLEQRAQEAILKSIVENYKQQRTDWQKQPAIRKATLVYSFFSSTNAAIIGGTVLLSGCLLIFILPILGLTGPIVLLGGLIVPSFVGIFTEIMFIVLSLKNEKNHAAVVAEMLKPKVEFSPGNIRDPNLKASVDKALEYWSLIDDAIDKMPKGVLQDRLLNTSQEVTRWLQAVYNLAERVDKFQLNKIITRDLQSVPVAIKNYEKKLAEEDNPEVHEQLQKTIADRKRQLQTLENLQNNIEKASYQLDSTLSSLGTIYSQLLLAGSKEEGGNRINRLQAEISEQVNQLEDLTAAMDEVYQEKN